MMCDRRAREDRDPTDRGRGRGLSVAVLDETEGRRRRQGAGLRRRSAREGNEQVETAQRKVTVSRQQIYRYDDGALTSLLKPLLNTDDATTLFSRCQEIFQREIVYN